MSLQDRYRQIESVTKYSNYYLGKCYTWLSIPVTDVAARMGLHPNHMTLISLVLGLGACGFFYQGSTLALILGALILYVSYVLDWCDGQLARFTGKMSPFGGWLDQMCDRIKEFAFVTTLALGYSRTHGGDTTVYLWALGALFFLFLLEYYGQMNRAIPQSQAEQQAAASAGPALGRPTAGRRKFVIDFSIDEQYAFVVLAAAILGAYWTLVGIVAISALFAIYKPLKAWKHYFSMK
ncbi:CDP-alcohol phosphatidyltransferase family protein [Tumebacillus sp. ITR2]|uniref:CDP-alcohol phosphatidyltransferase family protein n=1 Tax=Tumebacillus amylolyticus TaxID=2801339 RepID=A0ABS1J8G8_9BACL|nr:CDP-alcohol phosphatidyltransferase family protein [Tumebacillus amylolyticus]MBL0386582.1 CDP-alcohol phosphatidyltransferase family protein [Tumebacillus amylolyticus]